MNCYDLIELLENENIVVAYYLDEIFYDENDDEINLNEFHDDESDVDDEIHDKFQYLIENYEYEYELIVECFNDDVDELKKKIENVDDEIHVVDVNQYENTIELIYRNEWWIINLLTFFSFFSFIFSGMKNMLLFLLMML